MPKKSYSPLRYPGGKQSWMPIVLHHWEKHGLKPGVFVEPFAGGAGLSLALIAEGHVKHVVLAEKHHGIWNLFNCLSKKYNDIDGEENDINGEEFISFFENPENNPQLAFNPRVVSAIETLKLNYTNYQGILHPHARRGENRWDVQKIAKKLRQCYSILSKARVDYLEDYNQAIDSLEEHYRKEPFFFFDPPYYKQGSRLYQHSFNDEDHENLSMEIQSYNHYHSNEWMLAYNNHPRIWELYNWATIQVHPNGKELIITT